MRSLVQSFAVLVAAVGAVVGASLVWPLGDRGCSHRAAVGVVVGAIVVVIVVAVIVAVVVAVVVRSSCGC